MYHYRCKFCNLMSQLEELEEEQGKLHPSQLMRMAWYGEMIEDVKFELSLMEPCEVWAHLVFEKRYGMTSAEFWEKWQGGQLDDRMDFIEWASLIQMNKKAGDSPA